MGRPSFERKLIHTRILQIPTLRQIPASKIKKRFELVNGNQVDRNIDLSFAASSR
jgi:hypothetical protein